MDILSTLQNQENTSANTWEQDACFEVLKKLREKKEKECAATVSSVPKAHFNERLSSSTPDPEKVSPEKHHFQLIPERDTTPTTKEQLPTETGVSYTDQWMAGHMFSNINDHSFGHTGTQMPQRAPYVNNNPAFGGTSQLLNFFPSSVTANLGHGHVMNNIAPPGAPQTSYIQPAQNVAPGAPSSNFRQQLGVGRGVAPGPFGNSDTSSQALPSVPFQSIPTLNNIGNANVGGSQLFQTSSEGFVPLSNIYLESHSDTGRVSDIGAFQAFIPRDSLGFSPLGDTPQVYKEQKTDRTNSSGDSRKDHSGSLGERSVCSQGPASTPNSSGYVGLPTPKGNGKTVPNGIPAMQNENGLFQIHAHVEPCKDNIQNKNGGPSELSVHPPQTATNVQPNPMLYQRHNTDIPERDTAVQVPNKVPSVVTVTSSNKTPDASLNSQKGSSGLSQGSNPHVSGSDHTGSDQNNSLRDSNFPISQQQVLLNQQAENGIIGNERLITPMFVQPSPRSVTHVQGNLIPGENTVMQPVFLTYTANGAQIIPMKIADQNVALQGQQLAGYGLSMPLQGIVGQPQASNQKSVNSDRTPRSVSSESEGTKHDSVSEIPNNNPVSPNPWSKVKTDAKLKRVRYLLSELKECGKISKDVEVQRLAKDIEKNLDKVPQLSNTFSLQAEIDLAIQPLRSENSQLRRRLRLLNQQLKDQQIETDKIKEIKAVDLDVLHLQGANSALQKQIADLREDKVRLATEVTELNSNLQKMKIEKNKLLSSFSEKEMEDFRIKQEYLAETQKYRDEAEKHKRLVESSHLKHQAAEQECHILQITLQQRETEITRLQEIVETMKEGMAELLQELEHNKTVDKSWRENNSFGIQKLVKILEGDRPISPSCTTSDQDKTLSNNGENKHIFISQKPQTNLQNQKENLRAHPQRLTKQALADHDKIHSARSMDKAYATSDTEAEMVLETKNKKYKKSPLRRRHSSHSPQTRKHSLKNTNIHHSEDFHPNSGKYVGPSQKQNVEEIFHMLPKHYKPDDKSQQGPNVDKRIGFANNDYENQRQAIEGQSEAEKENDSDEFYYVVQPRQGRSDSRELVFLDQSRYSVTDYFKKYSQQPTNLDKRWHRRSLSQPNRPLKDPENKRAVYSGQISDSVNHRDKHHTRSNSQDTYLTEHDMIERKRKKSNI
ncbi:hypothetical protein KUTeg_001868 [Tegillarca granosa]|uniref:Uncharacterized protein n=1 Tax=Tegillarca granosa TaxID=220873 RepID=A0ABQ9FU46_TEGGR|nr:hypothetical protein KUTeg_001868 [Tegillarca granosa]